MTSTESSKPTSVWTTSKQLAEEKRDLPPVCGLCSGNYNDPRNLPGCKHQFCLKCIEKRVNGSSFFKCPACEMRNYLGYQGPTALKSASLAEEPAGIANVSEALIEKPLAITACSIDSTMCQHVGNGSKSSLSCDHCGLKFCKICEPVHVEHIKRVIDALREQRRIRTDALAREARIRIGDQALSAKAMFEQLIVAYREQFYRSIDDTSEDQLNRVNKASESVFERFQQSNPDSVIGLHEAASLYAKLKEPDISFEGLVNAFLAPPVNFEHNMPFKPDFAPACSLWTTLTSQLAAAVEKGDDTFIKKTFTLFRSPEGKKAIFYFALPDGTSLVQRAVVLDHLSFVRFFIEDLGVVKADHAVNESGKTLLHVAVQANRSRIIKYLVRDCKVDVNCQDALGFSPMHTAAVCNASKNTTEVLLELGASLEAHDSEYQTPLHKAAIFYSESVAILLITHKADVEAVDRGLHTPLHLASIRGNQSIVDLLIRSGSASTINWKNFKGKTPLHLAVASNHTHCATLLLENGADLYAKDAFGGLPLHSAVFKCSVDCVRMLLNRDPKTSLAKDSRGKTPAQCVLMTYGKFAVACLDLLREASEKCTTTAESASKDD